ncbi:MAG: metal-dependent transcriptional regulator [Bacteroidetes bacterium]|nr:MAG: metal-dependent transcriptional regulator [Bacteroidota bacterium]
MYSFTEENYLKAIFKLSDGGEVSTNALAEEMNTRAASVTDMIKKLSEKELVDYEKYKGVSLSDKGRDVAVSVVRKHRLWEVFLYDKLEFGWEEVHEMAEQLEHIQSDALIDRLDAFLNYPKYDPHGDPIPDKQGKFAKNNFIELTKAEKNKAYVLTGVSDHSPAFLKMLEKWGLAIGTELSVNDINEFDGSIELQLKEGNAIFLGQKSCTHILVKAI